MQGGECCFGDFWHFLCCFGAEFVCVVLIVEKGCNHLIVHCVGILH